MEYYQNVACHFNEGKNVIMEIPDQRLIAIKLQKSQILILGSISPILTYSYWLFVKSENFLTYYQNLSYADLVGFFLK
jgi:hypothetical protein